MYIGTHTGEKAKGIYLFRPKVAADADDANKRLKLVWIGCGREDGLFGESKSLSEFLSAHHVKHTFRETDGDHTWMVWRRYLHEIAPLLFR